MRRTSLGAKCRRAADRLPDRRICRRRRIRHRITQHERGGHGHGQKNSAEDHARNTPAEARKQHQVGERAEDRRAASEANQRKADGQAGSVGKPLGHDRYNRAEAESETDATQDSVEEVERKQTGREREEQKAQADQNATRKRNPERAEAVLQSSAEQQRTGEHDDRERKDRRSLRALPSKFIFKRGDENAPGVQRAEGGSHQHAAGKTPPAADRGPFPGEADGERNRSFRELAGCGSRCHQPHYEIILEARFSGPRCAWARGRACKSSPCA